LKLEADPEPEKLSEHGASSNDVFNFFNSINYTIRTFGKQEKNITGTTT